MAYTDDWESLMNGVFGAGGKLKFGGAQPQPEKPQPEKPAGSSLPDLSEICAGTAFLRLGAVGAKDVSFPIIKGLYSKLRHYARKNS